MDPWRERHVTPEDESIKHNKTSPIAALKGNRAGDGGNIYMRGRRAHLSPSETLKKCLWACVFCLLVWFSFFLGGCFFVLFWFFFLSIIKYDSMIVFHTDSGIYKYILLSSWSYTAVGRAPPREGQEKMRKARRSPQLRFMGLGWGFFPPSTFPVWKCTFLHFCCTCLLNVSSLQKKIMTHIHIYTLKHICRSCPQAAGCQ